MCSATWQCWLSRLFQALPKLRTTCVGPTSDSQCEDLLGRPRPQPTWIPWGLPSFPTTSAASHLWVASLSAATPSSHYPHTCAHMHINTCTQQLLEHSSPPSLSSAQIHAHTLHTHAHTHTYRHIHTYIHAHTYTHTNTHIHIHFLSRLPSLFRSRCEIAVSLNGQIKADDDSKLGWSSECGQL